MLKTIHVHNFALLKDLELQLSSGLSVLTGETGAGKSIILDALNLVSGARADSGSVGQAGNRAEVSAEFELVEHSHAAQRLVQLDLDDEDACFLRRVVTPEGRSRAYVNGRPVPVSTLREIGQLLVEIHGQHENRRLLEPARQMEALDSFAGNSKQLDQVQRAHAAWAQASQALEELTQSLAATPDQVDVWRYQLAELQTLSLASDDINRLESDHARLANADKLLSDAADASEMLDGVGDSSILKQLNKAVTALAQASALDSQLDDVSTMLSEALIQCEEASAEITRYLSSLESDPKQFQAIEDQLAQLHQLARKHRVNVDELEAVRTNISGRLENLEQAEGQLAALRAAVDEARDQYRKRAKTLSLSRAKAAKKLTKELTGSLVAMGMKNAQLQIELTHDREMAPKALGTDIVQVFFSANPGSKPALLSDVASGGEVSRVSLALKAATSMQAQPKTLVFDEVDTGVSGAAATTVGEQLRGLARNHQVLCVTHLPQVAAQGHQQFSVVKSDNGKSSTVTVTPLDHSQRQEEIARLLGSTKAGAKARANAAELLEQAQA